MVKDGDVLRLAATDVSNHLACRHLTQLDRAVAEGRIAAPAWRDPALAVLQQRGLAHEKAYIEHLRERGLAVVEPAEEGGKLSVERTIQAMRAGADAIVQAELRKDRWIGRADVLLKVSRPSRLGAWSYEVVDTKLAQETRAGTVLQLCLYSELVKEVQGQFPERMHVVKPGADFLPESFRFDDFGAYFRLVRGRLEETAGAPPSSSTYPDPVEHCGICRWWQVCDARRHADDNLCLVAGIRSLHTEELERQGINTLTQYAEEPKPYRRRPDRGSPQAFSRAHGQARIQLDGRRAGGPRYKLLTQEPGLGFFLLPDPDIGDVFFDVESDPFAGNAGMEYLLGVAFSDGDSGLHYRALWAFTPSEERRALEKLIDFIMARWHENPGMHIYHFSPYEPGAVKRLIGRHGTRETELDRLLRAGRFIDLLAVMRHGLQASVEGYSLKALEQFTGFTRAMELPAAAAALRKVAKALELAVPKDITADDRAAVEAYNRDDCLSTASLRDWLEARRAESVQGGAAISRPENRSGEASEGVKEKEADTQLLYQKLIQGLPEDREAWGPEERARWLLAHQLEYFRREEKCAWWEYFRIHGLDFEELMEERKALADLSFVGEVGRSGRLPVHRYSFPEQEIDPEEGKKLREIGTQEAVGTVLAMDPSAHTVDIVKNASAVDLHPAAVMIDDIIRPAPVDKAFLELARSIADNGVNGNGPYRAARDLLLAARPRLRGPAQGRLRKDGEGVVEAAVRLVKSLDDSILPVQGPPGSGKTYTGARMIVSLAREGKRVGVTAVSHKVIQKLLMEALNAASESGVALRAMRKDRKADGETTEGVVVTKDNTKLLAGLDQGAVVGGTAWFWSQDDMIETLDYLFVDEAGQMSLAHVLATARSARNIVLLGDPQQLEQPQKGAHPEGAEVAALVHILAGRKTILDDAGLFLDVTWRLHPRICSFTSELFYEGRLVSRTGLEKQTLAGTGHFAGSGLFYVPMDHTGNQNSSPEEVEAVWRIVRELRDGATWTDDHGRLSQLSPSDILVVAPYNAQVAALARRVGEEARIGTVDKFQGQEAPVVIYSMTSSSAQDAPRGMSFLYSPNRLNVATSRARCACILVASRRLLEPECTIPDQMRWANGLCRYREMAEVVAI